jgi:hypothetical protein
MSGDANSLFFDWRLSGVGESFVPLTFCLCRFRLSINRYQHRLVTRMLQGAISPSAVDLGITGLDYTVVTIFFVSQLLSIFRSRRVRATNVAMAGLYLAIWIMALRWGPLLLKSLTTLLWSGNRYVSVLSA